MRKVSSLIMVGVVFTAMFLQGCKITFNSCFYGDVPAGLQNYIQ